MQRDLAPAPKQVLSYPDSWQAAVPAAICTIFSLCFVFNVWKEKTVLEENSKGDHVVENNVTLSAAHLCPVGWEVLNCSGEHPSLLRILKAVPSLTS